MNRVRIIIMALLLLSLAAGSGYGQQQGAATGQGQQTGQSQQMGQQQGASAQQLNVIADASKLKGSKVVNNQGKELGKVDHVALDLQNGRISYVALDVGSGKGLIPVPFDRFGVLRSSQLVLDMEKDRLSQAPSFAKGRQPNWMDQNFAQSVTSFWGSAPTGIMTARTSTQLPLAGTGQQSMGTAQQPTPMGSQQPQQ